MRKSQFTDADRCSLTIFKALADNAGQAGTARELKMTFENSQANNDAPRGSKRRGCFRFSFFSFSSAATAEDAGV